MSEFAAYLDVFIEEEATFVYMRNSEGVTLQSWILEQGDSVRIGKVLVPDDCASTEAPRMLYDSKILYDGTSLLLVKSKKETT